MSFLNYKPSGKYLLGVMIAIFGLGFTGLYAHAQTLFGTEYEIKAAFIYNFAKFVEWPQGTFDENTDSITLCIIPNTSAGDVFFSLNNKKVGGKKMVVKKCEDTTDIEGCHMIFFDTTDKKFIQRILKNVKDLSILTVGHIKGFTQDGGIINFFTEKDKLRFEVNLEAAKHIDLKLGSQILMSAEIFTKESN